MGVCHRVRQQQAAYAAERIGRRARRRIDAHLGSCPDCARAFHAGRRADERLAAEMAALGRSKTPDLSWERLRASIADGRSAGSSWDRLRGLAAGWWRECARPAAAWRAAELRYWGARAAVPAAGMALAIFAFTLLLKGGAPTAPPTERSSASPVVIKIAFRPEGVPAPAGYYENSGQTYGVHNGPHGSIMCGWRE